MTKEPTGKAAAEETAAASGTGNTAAAGERPSTDGSTNTSTNSSGSTGTRRRGNRRAVSPGPGGPAGLLPVVAKEDDPRAWGDSTEDSESWLREQRPPHWG
ncbi:hypothetical protein [Arthrobacter sp. zg-Y1110]|uniref:hypothetical protein n=1 Tax=Arthrobacter sp. zg-Y1110 TaxID=2886932 RepID=UPI0027E16054|nr:hypothetical protein [Arthrobacter sp. zg-Y1110]